jgi:hypothetical protein
MNIISFQGEKCLGEVYSKMKPENDLYIILGPIKPLYKSERNRRFKGRM